MGGRQRKGNNTGLIKYLLICVFLANLTLAQDKPFFFDDFSRYEDIIDDTLKYQEYSEIRISNSIAINPPSKNVAVFDALSRNGIPYTSAQTARGRADSLISKPIDLSSVTSNEVNFEFFWQKQGLAEFPETEDSLVLQFRTDGGDWVSVWPTAPTDSTTRSFQSEVVPIPANFLTESFQFKFLLYSRLSGPYDVWLIDYISIRRAPQLNNGTYPDRSVTGYSGSLFEHYTAIPFGHFISNPQSYLSTEGFNMSLSNNERQIRPVEYAATITANGLLTDTLFSSFNNEEVITFTERATVNIPLNTNIWSLLDTTRQLVDMKVIFFLKNQDTSFSSTNTIAFTEDTIVGPTFSFIPQRLIEEDSSRVISGTLITAEMLSPGDTIETEDGIIIAEKRSLVTNTAAYWQATAIWENDNFPAFENKTVTEFPLADNDTLDAVFRLGNYYAYDDGTAETIYRFGGSGKIAYRFFVNEPHALTGVSMYFPQVFQENGSSALDFFVTGSLNENELYRETISISRASSFDEFSHYQLSSPVEVRDTFYIGWEQYNGVSTAIGFDRNNDAGGNIFYFFREEWIQNTDAGALMMRPLFDPVVDTVSLREQSGFELSLYPNPVNETLFVKGDFLEYAVYDLTGACIMQGRRKDETLMLSVYDLVKGMYLIRVVNAAGVSATERFIKY